MKAIKKCDFHLFESFFSRIRDVSLLGSSRKTSVTKRHYSMSKKVRNLTRLVVTFFALLMQGQPVFADHVHVKGQKIIRILSIDGGGQRGIVPAALLSRLEAETGKPITELFDVFAGTSTGSIIALGLNVPGEDGAPRFRAQDLVRLYETQGSDIFDKGFQYYTSLAGTLGPRYSPGNLKRVLRDHYGDTPLSEAMKPVYVAAYDLGRSMPFVFSSEDAKSSAHLDFPMRKAVRASSAAPSYFPPCHVRMSDGNKMSLSDGCFWALDPTEMVYEQVKRDNPGAKIIVVSLGTGTQDVSLAHTASKTMGALAWGCPLIGHLMHTQGQLARARLVSEESCGRIGTYLRVNFTLDEGLGGLDDTTPENLAYLSSKAHDIMDHDEAFAKVVSLAKSWSLDADERAMGG